MSYIVVVNPQILSGAGLPFSGVVTATALIAAVGSIMMGLVARLPYAVAPGMGLNAFFVYELVKGRELTPEVALGLVVWSGVIFVALSLTPLRENIARAIPGHLREAVAGGIGLLLVMVGLVSAGILVRDEVTFFKGGTLGLAHVAFLAGLVCAVWLHKLRRPYAFLVAMGLATLLGALLTDQVRLPADGIHQAPDFSLFGAADLTSGLTVVILAPMLTLLFTDLFDSLSTFLGVAQAANLLDEDGEPKNIGRALFVDATATLVSGVCGSSPGTTYVESTAGIQAGGRTGLTAIVAGLAFLPLIFFSPALAMVPGFATAPVLVVVGIIMARVGMKAARRHWSEMVVAIPVLVLIPLFTSITTGILWGIALHIVVFLLARRAREISPMMWGLFVVALGLLLMEHA
jgi:AGZA family xanthine/uracil permease-like MFS transporter